MLVLTSVTNPFNFGIYLAQVEDWKVEWRTKSTYMRHAVGSNICDIIV